jgi:hypothetical protein
MKAGTTSLYFYLKEHPEVYMSPLKEPKFFATVRPMNIKATWLNYHVPSPGLK